MFEEAKFEDGDTEQLTYKVYHGNRRWTYGTGDEPFLSMGMSTYRGEVKSVMKSCDFPMSPAVLSLFW